MKALRILFIVVLLAVFAVVPASADPPPEAGIVTHLDVLFGKVQFDFEAGLIALYGISAADLCAGLPNWDTVSAQLITLPEYEDVSRLLLHFHDNDVQTSVYPIEVWGDCSAVDDYIASGTARLNYTDNDMYVDSEVPNANAWGWTAQGKLVGADGSQMHFNAVYRITWKPDGSVENVVSKINLK